MKFKWIDYNVEHIDAHGVDPDEAEAVVEEATSPWPRKQADGKWLVVGRGRGGRWLQVAYVLEDDGTVFVIHARELEENEKKQQRRKKR